jgi:hypothetical protein
MRRAGSLICAGMLLVRAAHAAPPTKRECIGANEAAQDLRQSGRLREAREKLALCVSQSCPGPVREDCAQRLDEVNRAMPTLVFEVKDAAGNDVSAATVTMDGQPLADKLGGTSIPVDPGEHHFVFDDPDGISLKTETTVIVREGDKDRHVKVVLGGGPGPSPQDASTTAPGGRSAVPTASYVAFGVAGVGLIAGVGFTVAALVEKGKCTQTGCEPGVSGPANSNTVQQDTVFAGVGYGALLVGAGLGAFFFLSSRPAASQATVAPALGPGWLGLEGRFE